MEISQQGGNEARASTSAPILGGERRGTRRTSTAPRRRFAGRCRTEARARPSVLVTLVFFALLTLALPAMAGRADRPLVFKPSALVPVENPVTIMLAEQIRFDERSTSWAVPDMEMGLRAGDYVATVAAGGGVFYLGPDAAFYRGNAGKQMNLLRGGFWVPDDGGEPRLFWVVGIEGARVAKDSQHLASASPMKPQRLGLLAALSEKRQEGHLVLFPPAVDRIATEKLGQIVRNRMASDGTP